MSAGPSPDALRLEESVPLGYALLDRVARDHGVRLLAIKGPVLAAQGLREARGSVDVDVLVEPAGLYVVRAALEGLGWHDGGVYDTPGIVPLHSVNHRHPQWPCEIDLHHWFPGFLADPGVVFDVLWARRTTVCLAHVDLPAPDPVAHAALAALHYLRDSETGWGRDRLDELVAVLSIWDRARVADLAEVAAETGATQTLGPLLERLGAPHLPDRRPLAVPVTDWEMRSRARTREVLPWLVGLSRTPWWRRPAFVWRAVWMGDRRFHAWDRSTTESRRALRQARVRRLRRAVRALPAAAADLRRLR